MTPAEHIAEALAHAERETDSPFPAEHIADYMFKGAIYGVEWRRKDLSDAALRHLADKLTEATARAERAEGRAKAMKESAEEACDLLSGLPAAAASNAYMQAYAALSRALATDHKAQADDAAKGGA